MYKRENKTLQKNVVIFAFTRQLQINSVFPPMSFLVAHYKINVSKVCTIKERNVKKLVTYLLAFPLRTCVACMHAKKI